MRAKTFLCVLALALLCSCSRQTRYSEQLAVNAEGWRSDAALSFEYEATDTASLCDVLIGVRHNEQYPNQNLWLFVEQMRPDSSVVRDTVQCFLIDNQGRWIGSGIGDMHFTQVYYKQQVRFAQKGVYRYSIAHGMRYDALVGVSDISLKIIAN